MRTPTPNNNPTTGKDSLSKAIRRNLSPAHLLSLIGRLFSVFFKRGFEAAAREIGFRYRLATHGETWRYRADIPLRKTLRRQRKAKFPSMPLVSIIVPLYNTNPVHLTQLIKSVQKQSYQLWELMLVDASDETHSEPQEIAEKAKLKDGRIRYLKLPQNKGIAGNTNVGLANSSGDWLTLLDHDDILQPHALYMLARTINKTNADLVFSDEVVLDDSLKHLCEFHFKPDYGPDTLRGCNYMTHLCAFSYVLLESVGGGELPEFDGAQDYDLILRLSERARVVSHIPQVLYFWRSHARSTASDITQKPEAITAGENALNAHLERMKLDGTASALSTHLGAYRINYKVWGTPLVSVLIPNKDHIEDLTRCLNTLYEKCNWQNFEVLVLDNNSTDAATEPFYEDAQQKYENLKVLRVPSSGLFNFSAVCNFGAARAKGSHLLLLNNDVEITSDNFIPEMLSYSQRPDIGAVGAMLHYPDDTVQHAGLIVGIGGTAGVSHKGHEKGNGGDLFRLCTVQNISAVTGAALMVKRALYLDFGGFDEKDFAVAYNDVDFCLRLREKGFWNVFTPFAQGYHYESKSRGYDTTGIAKQRHDREAENFKTRHAGILKKGDPFYNRHFTLKFENFGYR